MQIYKDFSIGSSKPTEEERRQAPHHLIDFVDADKRYSVADYKEDCQKAIEDILSRGKVPIIVGGTGLYIDAIIYNIKYLQINTDYTYRKELEDIPLEDLYKRAMEIDPKAMEKISSNDRKRISRILEIYHLTGNNKTELEAESIGEEIYDFRTFVLNWPREILYERVNSRVDKMIEQGLVDEVKGVFKKYKDLPTSMQALGYKEIKLYLDGIITLDEAIELIKTESRHYAKRQLTWFRKYEDAIWLEGGNDDLNANIIMENYNRTIE
jgi:tRNA dimethylallyltransferase